MGSPNLSYLPPVNKAKSKNAQRDKQNEIGRTFLSKGLGKEEAAVALAHLHPEPDNAFDPYSIRLWVPAKMAG